MIRSVSESRPLRADARRNRETLVATARLAFAAHGLDASLDDIAKRAGVGSGTLYRHFPTREQLVAAVYAERLAENVALAERELQNPDPWDGFTGYVHGTCMTQVADRGLAELVGVGYPDAELSALRIRAYELATQLGKRAKASGTLREDFSTSDIALLVLAVAGVIRRADDDAERFAERFIALALDGYSAEGATTAPPAIPLSSLQQRLR
jgi:AcrR family transcriptional regulator